MNDIHSAERRRVHRHSIEQSVALLIESDRINTSRPAVTVNLSDLGAQVQCDASLSPGQSIDVIAKVDGVQHIVPAQVIWVNGGRSSESREAGLSFTDPERFPLALLSGLW